MPLTPPVLESFETAVSLAPSDNIDVAQPSGVQRGDLLVLLAGCDDPSITAQWPVKAGWSLAVNAGSEAGGVNPECKWAVYWRWADGTEPLTANVAYAFNADIWASYLRLSNVHPEVPFDTLGDVGINDHGTDPLTSHDILGMSVTKTAVLGVGVIVDTAGGLTFAWPAAWTEHDNPVAAPGGPPGCSGSWATSDLSTLALDGGPVSTAVVTSSAAVGAVKGMFGINGRASRDRHQLLDEYLKQLPSEYVDASDLLGGIAAEFERVERDGADLVSFATVGQAGGIWLTLQGAGMGVDRSTNESNASLRERIRNIEERVTPGAILEAASALFALETTLPVLLVEWFETPFLNADAFYLNTHGAALSAGGSSFLLFVPELTTDFAEPVYAAVARAIERLRAAGVFWTMVLVPAASYVNRIPNRTVHHGMPLLIEVGDITSVDRDGMDTFSASNYALVDINTLVLNDLRTWGWKVSWLAALTHNSPLMGRAQAAGVSIWVEVSGDVRVVFEEGGVTRVDETVALGLAPITIGKAYWVLLQMDRRASGEPGEVGGALYIVEDGGLVVVASGTWSASGTGTHDLDDDHQLGRDVGLGIVGPGVVAADEMKIHEFIEYDATGDGFLLTADVALGIGDGSDPRVQDQAVRYDGSDDVVV